MAKPLERKETSEKIKFIYFFLFVFLFLALVIGGIAVTEYASGLYHAKQIDELTDLFGILFWGGGLSIILLSLIPSIHFYIHKLNLSFIDVYPKDILTYGLRKIEWDKKNSDYIDFYTKQGYVRIKDHEELRNNERFFKTIRKGEHWVSEPRFYNHIIENRDKIDYISVAISDKFIAADDQPVYSGFKHVIVYKDGTEEVVDNHFYDNYLEDYYKDSKNSHMIAIGILGFIFVFCFFAILKCFLLKGGGHWLALQYFIRLWDSFSSFFSDLLG